MSRFLPRFFSLSLSLASLLRVSLNLFLFVFVFLPPTSQPRPLPFVPSRRRRAGTTETAPRGALQKELPLPCRRRPPRRPGPPLGLLRQGVLHPRHPGGARGEGPPGGGSRLVRHFAAEKRERPPLRLASWAPVPRSPPPPPGCPPSPSVRARGGSPSTRSGRVAKECALDAAGEEEEVKKKEGRERTAAAAAAAAAAGAAAALGAV